MAMAELRDGLLAELNDLGCGDDAAIWARRNLGAKDGLTEPMPVASKRPSKRCSRPSQTLLLQMRYCKHRQELSTDCRRTMVCIQVSSTNGHAL